MLIQGSHLGVLHRLKAQLHQCDAADQSGSAKAGSSPTWYHWFDFTVSHFQSFDWLSSFSIHHPLYRLVRLGKCFKNLPLSLKLKSLTDLGWFVAKDVFELFFFLTKHLYFTFAVWNVFLDGSYHVLKIELVKYKAVLLVWPACFWVIHLCQQWGIGWLGAEFWWSQIGSFTVVTFLFN